MVLANKKILLGITGGIAAYKCPDLIRQLKKQGAEVRVVLTTSARHFVTELTLQVVSQNPVCQNLFDTNAELAMSHIELAKWADVVLIAPATANVIAKLTYGIADDLLSAICLASPSPIVIVPAMNREMYFATITQENISKLALRPNYHIWGPDTGQQACGDTGLGRMLEPTRITKLVTAFFEKKLNLSHLHFMITAGPTQEAIDPVRYISNHSSGLMGFELAKAAAELGAKVTLVSGPVKLSALSTIHRIDVVSACEMHNAVMQTTNEADIFIACAAVADYRAETIADQKIKKQDERLTIPLIKNPDIVADVARLTSNRPFVVAFAAETQDMEKQALKKLVNKNVDLICANQVSIPNQGFNSVQNAITLYGKKIKKSFPLMPKNQLARQLIEEIINHYEKNDQYQDTGFTPRENISTS